MSDYSGLSSLVSEVREASNAIAESDNNMNVRLDSIETSINDLYRKTQRPGVEWHGGDDDERKCAVEMCRVRHYDRSPKNDGLVIKEYEPTSSEIQEAELAREAFRQYLRVGDISRLDPQYAKSLSAFSFGGSGFLLPPQQANFTIRCLADPTDLSGLVDSLQISGPSLRVLIDNATLGLGEWACDSSCFSGHENPDLVAGVGHVEIKPETIRLTVCTTRDLIEDASINVEAWIRTRIDDGLRATINSALILGDGAGKPLGLLHPRSGIPICETSANTPPGQFSWADLIMLKYEIPTQWQNGSSFVMNQRTFALLLTMQDALGRPVWSSLPGEEPGFRLAGSPVVIASQMPDVQPGSTPVAFGNWRKTYLVVWRKGVTVTADPYSAGFCVLYRAEARVGGAPLCPNAARLLRIR